MTANTYRHIGFARMVLNMFRNGNDTVDIAKHLSITEAHACNLLEIARKDQVHALEAERKAAAF